MIWKLFKINLGSIAASLLRYNPGGRRTRSSEGAKPQTGAGRKFLLGFLFVYIAAAMVFAFGAMFYGIRDSFVELGVPWLYFALALLISFFLSTLTCIFQAYAIVFNAKDNEILLPLPIRPSVILTSRILTLLASEYVFELAIMVPALFIWLIGGYGTLTGVLFFILGLLLIPLLSLAVATFLAWLIALISSRMRRRNIATLIIASFFTLGSLYLAFNLQKYMLNLFESGYELADSINRSVIFAPAYHFGLAAADGNAVSFLIFAAFAVIPFAILIWLLSRSFYSVVTRNRGLKKKEFHGFSSLEAVSDKKRSIAGALLVRELRRIASNAMLILNMSLGSVLAIILAILLAVMKERIVDGLGVYGDLMKGLNIHVIAVILLLFCSATSLSSASLVSLEGKNLWILRSLPIKTQCILQSKVNLHLVISGAPVLLASIITAVGLGGSVLQIAAVIITPALYTVFMAYAGIYLNLLKPKFDWLNEVQPVKQGLPVMILMFGSWGIFIGLGLIYGFLFSNILKLEAFLFLCDAVILGAVFFLNKWLMKQGAYIWDNL